MRKEIKDFEVGAIIQTALLNGGLSIRETKTGKEYLTGSLTDKSGSITFNQWDIDTEKARELKDAEVLFVEAEVDSYNGNKQLKVKSLREADKSEYDISDLLYIEDGNYEGIVDDIKKYLDEYVTDMNIYALADHILSNHFEKFKTIPAAISHHHSALGGMAVHVKQIIEIALGMMQAFKPIMSEEVYNEEIQYVVAGSIMHDIGKFYEYTENDYGYCVGFTPQGSYFGHLAIGANLILDTAKTLGIEPKVANKLAHIAASHHEKQEWGALMPPGTISAMIVSKADAASAFIHPFILEWQKELGEVSEKKTLVGSRYIKER